MRRVIFGLIVVFLPIHPQSSRQHVLNYFKSPSMTTVSFGDKLKHWIMFPKNNPSDIVEIDVRGQVIGIMSQK